MPGSNFWHGCFHGYTGRRGKLLKRDPVVNSDHRFAFADNPIDPNYLPTVEEPVLHKPTIMPKVVRIVTDARVGTPNPFIPINATNLKVKGQALYYVWDREWSNFIPKTWFNRAGLGDPVFGYTAVFFLQGVAPFPPNNQPYFRFPDRAVVFTWEFDGTSMDGTADLIAAFNGFFVSESFPLFIDSGPHFEFPLYQVKFRYTLPGGQEVETPFITLNGSNDGSTPSIDEVLQQIIDLAKDIPAPAGTPPNNVDEWAEFAEDVQTELGPEYIVVYENRPNGFNEIGYWMFRHTVPGAQLGGEGLTGMLEHNCSTMETFTIMGLCDDTAAYDMNQIALDIDAWIDEIDSMNAFEPPFSGIPNRDNVRYEIQVLFDKGFAVDWDLVETYVNNKVHENRLIGIQAPSMWGWAGDKLKIQAFVDDQVDYKLLKSQGVAEVMANRARAFFNLIRGIEE